MNPIYRFELSQNGANTRAAKPNYNNDLSIEYALEQNEEFYRGKLSGKLTFQQDDYAYIKTAAFDTQFDVEIFISYDGGQTWASYWKGKFFKTDCEFNDDDQTAIVTPTLNDRYNNVLAGLEKEYNLIDLAPVIQPIKYDKRPMIQIYVPGQSVIGCFLSGMWWEQECEPIDDETALVQTYKFAKNRSLRVINVLQQGSPEIPDVFVGEDTDTEFTNGNYKIKFISGQGVTQWQIIRVSDDTVLWFVNATVTIPGELTLNPVSGSGATGQVKIYINEAVSVYARYVTDVESAFDVSAYPIPDNDIVANNRNYHYILGYYFPSTITVSTRLTADPTKWGIYQPGQYYQQPYVLGGGEFYPIARAAWGRVSLWFSFYIFDWVIEQEWRKEYTLKDAFPIFSVISVLLGQIAPSITHDGTTDYSSFLYAANNPISNIAQTLFITPKSNVINSGYDQPAQKAPITLRQVLNMLRDCFRCYWFIDGQNRFRIEHISWFMRGGSYTGTPVVGIDLTKEIVTRNGKPWSYARNQYQFDKPDMAARYQFGWMDDVTELFDGFPIDIISKYVNPDNIENIDVAQFTSDIDYILLNPVNISNDGFVLLGAIRKNKESAYDVYNYAATIGTTINQYSPFVPQNQESIKEQKIVGFRLNIQTVGTLTITRIQNFNQSVSYNNSQKVVVQQFNITNVGVQDLMLDNPFVLQENEMIGFSVPSDTAKFYYKGGDGQPQAVKFYYNTGSAWGASNEDLQVGVYIDMGYKLPYMNFAVNETNHILQNAYLSFVFLQRYYAYDMPAKNYRINGIDMIAQGIKKMKTQTIKFPVLIEPNMTELVKTGLGNGTIQKMSVNLSSRNANTTLKYDTE